MSPYDTPLSSGLRFAMELVAWVAGPWAAAEITGAAWTALPALGLLLVLPGAFNVPGDKNTTGIAVPGWVRLMIEALLLAVAVGAAWIVWPPWAAVVVSAAAVATVATGLPRYRWLAAGARPVDG